MASFYSSEEDMLPTAYMLNQKFTRYPSSQLNSNKEYTTQPSVPFPHINMLSGSSMSDHEFVQSESVGSRDEMVFMPPTSIQAGMQQIARRSDIAPHYSDGNKVITDTMYSKESLHCSGSEPIPRYHSLSLSLGSQEPPLVQLHSELNQYTNSSFCSMLNSDVHSEIQMSQNNDLKNVQYLSFDLGGQTQDAAPNSLQNIYSSKDASFIPSVRQESDVARMFCSSKYHKAAQDLLTEVVSVHRAPKVSQKAHNFNDGMEVKRDVSSADLQESNNELPPAERNEQQNKIIKLMDMLDEVDRRYKQYCHQMQAVVSSFDMMAGHGSAQPYTALARRTISRQFGTLRDAIKKQIQVIQKSLGEQDSNPHGLGVLSRLRFVDQQLRQQKAIQHFGIMRQPWRPQRGLPETAVSVLRAWLFEHFLHPYPKDSEKLVLARQTGLTRSQVANWFINARVRLWKPMIEEMYKDEFGDTETELKSSPENATTAQDIPTFDDKEEEFQGSLMSADANRQAQSNESMLDFISSSQIDGSTYDNGAIQGNGVNFGLSMPNKQIVEVGGSDIFSADNNHNASSNKAGGENVIATGAAGHHGMIMDSATANQVSLALGLQHHDEKDSESIVHGVQQKRTDVSSSSEVLDKLDYYYTDPVNNEHRFANTHLLSDFVV